MLFFSSKFLNICFQSHVDLETQQVQYFVSKTHQGQTGADTTLDAEINVINIIQTDVSVQEARVVGIAVEWNNLCEILGAELAAVGDKSEIFRLIKALMRSGNNAPLNRFHKGVSSLMVQTVVELFRHIYL